MRVAADVPGVHDDSSTTHDLAEEAAEKSTLPQSNGSALAVLETDAAAAVGQHVHVLALRCVPLRRYSSIRSC